jgi:hypothetical protein
MAVDSEGEGEGQACLCRLTGSGEGCDRVERTSRYWSSGLKGQQRGNCSSLPRADPVRVSSRRCRCCSGTGEDVEGGKDERSAVGRFPSFQCISWSVELGFVKSVVAQSKPSINLPRRLPFSFIALHERAHSQWMADMPPIRAWSRGLTRLLDRVRWDQF